jgi:hypothetical protein
MGILLQGIQGWHLPLYPSLEPTMKHENHHSGAASEQGFQIGKFIGESVNRMGVHAVSA